MKNVVGAYSSSLFTPVAATGALSLAVTSPTARAGPSGELNLAEFMSRKELKVQTEGRGRGGG